VQWYAKISDYPVQGKKLELSFNNSNTVAETTVTALVRPSVLEYTWDSQRPAKSPASLVGSVVRFELSPHEGGTVLTLDHIFTTDSVPTAEVLGGWQVHLDELAKSLHSRGFTASATPLAADFLAACADESSAYAEALGAAS
jgi:uncharacterized protein YndB with AHSA1/START domain